MGAHASPEQRREEILNAALICFADKGYHDTKMDDIVGASGLSKGSLYWHFDSKEEIFLGLFEQFNEAIFQGWEQLEADDVLQSLRNAGDIALERLLAARPLLSAWTEFFRHQTIRGELAKSYTQARAILSGFVRKGVRSGILRKVDADHIAALLTATVEGLLLQAAVDPNFDARAAWPTAFDTIARGLKH